MTNFLEIRVEVFAGVIIPCITGAWIIAWRIFRYFQNKEICFNLQKQRIENRQTEIEEIQKKLDDEKKKAHDVHVEFFKKLNTIEKNIVAVMTKQGIVIQD
jgi:hypothetical protein